MADTVDRETRSRMMRGIHGKNTQPEIRIRRILHAAGFRFRIHVPKLPGRPDIVLRRRRAVILIHGCFWHGHDCHLFRLPGTRREFWKAKIDRNRANDARTVKALREQGWRVAVIWECAARGAVRMNSGLMESRMLRWIQSDSPSLVLKGRKARGK